LVLTSTGNCTPVMDQMQLSFSPAPIANAGSDVSVCENNPAVSLNGNVTIAASGIWSGGLGTYSPNSTSLTTSYTPTAAEISSGTTVLTLTTTGNGVCNAETDNIIITYTASPTVDAGVNQSVCENNTQVNLSGSKTLSTGVIWSGGGTFSPNVNALNPTYTPSAAELLSGSTVLGIATTGNGGCNAVNDVVTLTFTSAPTANANIDQSICSNNSLINLNGSATIATGGQWSGGLGVFTPNNNTLNATYQPTNSEINSGSLNLVLTTTGNGNCVSENDNMNVAFTASPTVDAGLPQVVCSTSPAASLSGTVTIAGGGIWSGGLGTYSPNNTSLNTTYTPTAAEIASGSVLLYLTTTGNANCNPEVDSVLVTITPTPTISAGPDQSVCYNNASVNLSGSVTIATGGIWSGGLGTFTPSTTDLNAVYVPTVAESNAGSVTLTLTSTGNGNCIAVSDNVIITITPAPIANASIDQTICSNNSAISLNGSVSIATGGQWSGGLGVFTPNNNTLNATYQPTSSEINSGTLNLVLTTTGNANCVSESDDMDVAFTASPTVDAGLPQSTCSTTPAASLSGTVTIAGGGVWSGGLGTYSPNNTSLNTTYTPTAAEIASGSVLLYLTTTGNGNCNPEVDSVLITITPSPTVSAGSDQSVCYNNSSVNLSGSVTIATGGIWSGGLGTFTPSTTDLNAVYVPTVAESNAGSVTLTLTSTGNGNCIAVSDNIVITITPAPTASANIDQTICSNNSVVSLNGSVSVATGGQWSGGLGVFAPNNNTLNATYQPTITEIANGTLNLVLTTTGNANCTSVSDDMDITFTASPTIDAGLAQTVCSTSPSTTLSGSVSIATGGVWSGGLGSFSPNAASLTASYTPTLAEIASGSVQLYLTSTGNGNCNAVRDSVLITITAAPLVNAGPNATSCANNSSVNLGGTINNATGGIWSGGGGNYVSSNTDLNAVYTPSNSEILAGSVNLTLTSTGNVTCASVSDNILITILPAPTADAGLDQSVCANNATVSLVGSVTGASGGQWSGGLGTYTPSNNALNATYTPSATELLNGNLTLTLTTTGNGTCTAVTDNVVLTFTTAPNADAGLDISSCENNPQATLNGGVTISTGGQWTGGTGTYAPSNTDLNAVYTPSTTEITNGSALIILQTTGNGNCNMESDSVLITIDPSPVVAAGVDQTICVNNLNVTLSGSVSGITNTGVWTTNGSGFFVPNTTALNANYVPSSADSIVGSVTLTLTSTNGNACLPVSDDMLVTILPAGISNAGADVTVCANNSTINLSGNVSGGASTGVWTTNGTGVFVPDNLTLNANYIPSPADAALGNVLLTLTANSCDSDADNLIVTITPAPLVAAGPDVTVCANNLTIPLNGSVSGATTTGVWTSSGTGTFTPSNTDLNASYVASSQDSLNQTVTLVLTATNFGLCAPETDTMLINVFPTGTADGGLDQILCENNGNVQLTGLIGGGSTIGEWNSSGSGTFVPNVNDMNAIYVPSAADVILGSVNISLSAVNSCNNASDVIGVTYTPAPAVDAGNDTSICGTNAVITLSGNVIGAVGGEWSTSGTGIFSPTIQSLNVIYNASSQDIANGGVWIYLTSIGNGDCNATVDSLRLTITTGINVNAGVDQTVCSTSSFTVLQGLVSNGTSTGVWSTLGSGTFAPSATALTTEYHFGSGDLVNGSVDLVLTSTNSGSCVPETDTMTIFFGTTAFASAGNDFFMCGSSTTTGALNGYVSGGATQGQWTTLGTGSFGNNTDFNTEYTPSVTDLANGFFELVLTTTDNGTCVAGVDTVLVTVESVPLANAGANIQACTTSDTIQLSGSVTNASGGIWSTGGTGSFFPSDTILNAEYVLSSADLASGSIQLYLTTLGSQVCGSHTDSITVTLSDPLTINFGNSVGCENNFMSFYDSTIIHFGSISEWNWDFGDGGTSQSPNPLHLYTTSGAYDVELQVTSNLGCEYNLIQSVLVQGSPVANFALPIGDVIANQAISYTDFSVGGISWSWTFGDGGTSVDQNPTYTYSSEGQYSVLQRVTNAFGCSDTALLVLTVLPEAEPYYPPVVPSGFSPNGDGENDVLYVRGGPFESVILRVYNNWGNLIFESDDVAVGWDGTHKGKDQPKGDYVYSAIVIGLDGKEYIKKGSISIIR